MLNTPVHQLLPHGEKALLVDDLLSVDAAKVGGIVSSQLLLSRSYWDQEKGFRSLWLVEALAQAVAAVFGYSEKDLHPNSLGYLIAIDDFKFSSSTVLVVNDILSLKVVLEHDLDPVGVWKATATKEGEVVAEARFKCLVDREGSLLNQS